MSDAGFRTDTKRNGSRPRLPLDGSRPEARRFHLRPAGAASFRRWHPAFIDNAEQFRRVLVACCWRYAHGNTLPEPAELELLLRSPASVERDATRHCRRLSRGARRSRQKKIFRSHARACAAAGGYLHLIARVVYLRYRCGWPSTAVAQEMRLTPVGVRQICFRVLQVARALNFETFAASRSRGRKK